jgi:hypothetical protein
VQLDLWQPCACWSQGSKSVGREAAKLCTAKGPCAISDQVQSVVEHIEQAPSVLKEQEHYSWLAPNLQPLSMRTWTIPLPDGMQPATGSRLQHDRMGIFVDVSG